MQSYHRKLFWACSMITLTLLLSGCGMKQVITGKVIDAETKLPVEGAAVGIKWTHYKIGAPGLPVPRDLLGTTELLTNKRGEFSIPKYYGFGRDFDMAIYKEEYICWTSWKTYNPKGTTYNEIYLDKDTPDLFNGMIIELQPIKGPISYFKYHDFVLYSDTRLSATKEYEDAVKRIRENQYRIIRQRNR